MIYVTGNNASINVAGNGTKINVTGNGSEIVCSGADCRVKATIGSTITLIELPNMTNKASGAVKTEVVDGERIKAGVWYTIINGEFEEVDE